MKKYNADIHSHGFSEDGIDEFYWPITHHEMNRFAALYMREAVELLHQFEDNDVEADIYKFTLKYFIAEAGGLFQGELLKQRFSQDGIEAEIPQQWSKWPYIFRSEVPPMPAFLKKLRAQTEKPSLLKRLMNPKRVIKLLKNMNFSKGGVVLDGLKVASLDENIIHEKIIATHRSGIISDHAESVKNKQGEDVYFFRSFRWFSPIESSDEAQALKKSNIEIEAAFLKITEEIYTKWGLDFPEYARLYLQECLSRMAALLRVHYTRLLMREDIPARLWTGTGGNIWDLMLRKAVMHNGGTAIGHDHGGGTARVNIDVVGFIELWACDSFVTFNKKQMEELTNVSRKWPLLDKKTPEITYIAGVDYAPILTKKIREDGSAIKKVFVLATLYDADRGRSFAFYPDVTYADWQARLIGHLKNKGYDVYFKPHPESQIKWPKDFEEKLGAKIAVGRFEEIMHEADLFIIDYTYTSVMLPAFETNIPIVLVDFEGLNWYPDAYSSMKKRVSLIESKFDEKNRVVMDWEEFDEAIVKAVDKTENHDYLNLYFRDGLK